MPRPKIYSPNRKRKPMFLQTSSHRGNTSLLSKGTSKQEISLANTVQLLLPGEKIIHNDRTILKGHELDIYIPSRKVAIEFDGLYWHSSANGKDQFYHLKKSIECERSGIQLLHIWSNDWEQKKLLVIDIIKKACGIYETIPAEACAVIQLSLTEQQYYLAKYNLTNYNLTVKKCIGLEAHDCTVAVLAISKNNEVLYIERPGIHVINGLQKLIQQYTTRPITAICDRRYYSNKDYIQAGFTEITPTNPAPYYTKDFSTIKTSSELSKFTEAELVNRGYSIIYDCGLRRFKLE